jgi:Ca2+-transporting ATPase
VIRDGKQTLISSDDLVPGDVVVLEEGDAVPADLRLVDVSQLQVVESILTGESLPVQKSIDAIKARVSSIVLNNTTITCKLNYYHCRREVFQLVIVKETRSCLQL